MSTRNIREQRENCGICSYGNTVCSCSLAHSGGILGGASPDRIEGSAELIQRYRTENRTSPLCDDLGPKPESDREWAIFWRARAGVDE